MAGRLGRQLGLGHSGWGHLASDEAADIAHRCGETRCRLGVHGGIRARVLPPGDPFHNTFLLSVRQVMELMWLFLNELFRLTTIHLREISGDASFSSRKIYLGVAA